MPGAVIVADQARPGETISHGSPGVARNDLWVGWAVQLLDGAGGNNTYEWSFLTLPPGSAAALSGADGQGVSHEASPTFIPDYPGTYRVRFQTNGGGPGNLQIRVFRVRYDDNGDLIDDGWILPAHGEMAGESNYPGNLVDWAEPLQYIFTDARTRLRALEKKAPEPADPGDVGKYLRAEAGATASWVTIPADGAANVASLRTLGTGGQQGCAGNDSRLSDARIPTGSAGGDLGNTYPNPQVRGLTHITSDLLFQQAANASIDISGHALTIGASATGLNFGGVAVPVASLGPFTALGSKVMALPLKLFVQGIAGRVQTAQTGGDEVGALVFDPSAFFAGNSQITRTIRFVAVLECGAAGQTCTLELFNYTDNVSVGTVATSSTTATTVTSSTLTVPANLPNSQKLYTLRMSRTGGSSSDFVTCKNARLEIIYS